MDLAQANEIARVLSMAHGGCPECVSHLAEEAQKVFPEFNWMELVAQWENGAVH